MATYSRLSRLTSKGRISLSSPALLSYAAARREDDLDFAPPQELFHSCSQGEEGTSGSSLMRGLRKASGAKRKSLLRSEWKRGANNKENKNCAASSPLQEKKNKRRRSAPAQVGSCKRRSLAPSSPVGAMERQAPLSEDRFHLENLGEHTTLLVRTRGLFVGTLHFTLTPPSLYQG